MNQVAERWNETGQIAYPFAEDSDMRTDTQYVLAPGVVRDLMYVGYTDDSLATPLSLEAITRTGNTVIFGFTNAVQMTAAVASSVQEVQSTADGWLLRLVIGPEVADIPEGTHTLTTAAGVDRCRTLDYRKYRVLTVTPADDPDAKLLGDIQVAGGTGIVVSNITSRNTLRVAAFPGAGTGYPCQELEVTYDRDTYTVTYLDSSDLTTVLFEFESDDTPYVYSITPTGGTNRERAGSILTNLFTFNTPPFLLDIQHIPVGADGGQLIFSFIHQSVTFAQATPITGALAQTGVTPENRWSIPRSLTYASLDGVVSFTVAVRPQAYASLLANGLGYLLRAQIDADMVAWNGATNTVQAPLLPPGGESLTTVRSWWLALGAGASVFEVSSPRGVSAILPVADEAERLQTTSAQRQNIVHQLDEDEYWQWNTGGLPMPATTVLPASAVPVPLAATEVEPAGVTWWDPYTSTLGVTVTSELTGLSGVYYLPPGQSAYVLGTLQGVSVLSSSTAVVDQPDLEWDPGEPAIERIQVTDPARPEIEGVYYKLDGAGEYVKGTLDTGGASPSVDSPTHRVRALTGTWELVREDNTQLLYGVTAAASPSVVADWTEDQQTVESVTRRIVPTGGGPWDWTFRDASGPIIAHGTSTASTPAAVVGWEIRVMSVSVSSAELPALTGAYYKLGGASTYVNGTLSLTAAGVELLNPTHELYAESDSTGTYWKLRTMAGEQLAQGLTSSTSPGGAGPWQRTGYWELVTPRTLDEPVGSVTDSMGMPIPINPSGYTYLAFGGGLLGFLSCADNLLWINGQPANSLGEFRLNGIAPLRVVPDPDAHTLYVETTFMAGTGGSLECWNCLENGDA